MSGSNPSGVKALAAMLIAVLLALLVGNGAWAENKKDGACRYDTSPAHAAFKKRDDRRAVELFTKAITWIQTNCKDMSWTQSGLWRAYKFRAAAYTYLKDYGKAVQDLVAMSKQSFQEWSPGEEKWVFAAYDGAVRRHPNDASLRDVRASALQTWASLVGHKDPSAKKGYLKTALADRNAQVKLVHTKKERAEVLANRAHLYSDGGAILGPDAPQRALKDISTAIELDPKGLYYAQRADLHSWKQPKLAFEDISKAIELEPKGWYYKKRAAIRQTLKQPPEEVMADLSAAVAKTSPHDSHYAEYLDARADLLKKSGKLDEAEKDYAAIVKLDPSNTYRRRQHLLALLELGRKKQADAERKTIARLDPKALQDSGFVCKLADITAKRAGKVEAASPEAQRKAWALGDVVAVVPLQHLIGKPNAKADKVWANLSDLVQAGEKAAGKPPHGLDAIPTFKGSKTAQVQQAVGFIFRQRNKVSTALAGKLGDQGTAVFAVSSAGYMAETLNRMGVPNVNRQLGAILEKEGPMTGLPCYVWVHTAIKAQSRAKPDEVVKAWDKGSKDAKKFWDTAKQANPHKATAPETEKKSQALPKSQQPTPSRAAGAQEHAKSEARPGCASDPEFWDMDSNTIPPC